MARGAHSVVFRPLRESDLPLVTDGLGRPHVRDWWGGGEHDPTIEDAGVGTRMVRAFVRQLFAEPRVTKAQADPDPANLRAIRYGEAGFRPWET
jgi:RimJ/RimL family protein N-acetyltransferase